MLWYANNRPVAGGVKVDIAILSNGTAIKGIPAGSFTYKNVSDVCAQMLP